MSKRKSSQKAADRPTQNQLFIVGIGASAGGVEALTQFFEQVTADSGLAYVIILHLSPDYDSQLTQLIQRVTQIPVTQVTERVHVEANHVYVVPPNKQLQMDDGMIMALDHARIEERRAPVDIFFRTLADSHGPGAIAVILSGTGANGSMGLKMIKEKGGAVFVQNPREATFNEMPRHAIATDLVDDILPVAQIPERLIAYRQGLGTVYIPEEAPQRPEDQQQALREVFTQLRIRTGHDFSNYKRSTLLRRLERRISIHSLTSLPAYATFLRENPDETQALLKDLLISVTNFFRDEKAFAYLENNIMPMLTQSNRGKDTLRIWVAGCATGEEAYSIAMLCAERTLSGIDTPKVQIFATDIDEDAIAMAREGLYTLNDAADVSPERLGRFFTKEGDSYRIRREIRETILFAHHNVLKDPPFSQLDLISCRNLLIYLNSVAQERVMETFHFALKPSGYLLLGLSETVDGSSDLYATANREYHLYQSRQVASRPYPVPESIPQLPQPRKRLPEPTPELEGRPSPRLSFGDLHQQLLEQYAPPSVIVNEEYDILHFTPRAGRYMHFAGGELSKNVLKLIRPELRLELRTALYQATQQQINVEVQNLPIQTGELLETINLHVRPVLSEGNPAHGFVLILFELVSDAIDNSTPVLTSIEPMARQLEEELIRAKAQLRSSNEQHELQAEELKASNEELQAMNEELRSAAEELETGKEEMQSINEELTTVNQELKVKVEESSLISNNLQNLINSTDIATLFLNRSFRVNLFTPACRQIFNLIPSDLGRPLTDITNRLDYNHLQADAESVLETLQPLEREVKTVDGRVYITRILPYRTAEDRINGVVITFVDIAERKAAEEDLRKSEEKYRMLFTSIDEGYCIVEVKFDDEGRAVDYQYLDVNPAFEKQTGIKQPVGKWMRQLVPQHEQLWFDTYGEIAKSGQDQRFEAEAVAMKRWYDMYGFRVGKPGENKVGIIFKDITERKATEEALRESKERLRLALEAARMGTFVWYPQEDRGEPDIQMLELFGQPADGTLTLKDAIATMIHPDDKLRYAQAVAKATDEAGSGLLQEDIRILLPDGQTRWLTIIARVYFIGTPPQAERMIGSAIDITRQKVLEESLRQSEARQAFLVQLSDALRPLADAAQIQYTTASMLGEYLKANRVHYSEAVDDYITVRQGYSSELPPMIGTFRAQDFGEELTNNYRKGITSISRDVDHDPTITPAERQTITDSGYRAYIAVPLIKQGHWVAALTVHSILPRDWNANEVELVQEVAERTWAAVERAQVEEALRLSEQRFASIRPLTLLGQTEELAKIGSWEYYYPTDQWSWSDGMYTLLGSDPTTPPNSFLKFALESDQDNARRLASYLNEGEGSLQINLQIRVKELIKTIRIKADVLHEGEQKRVMGVALDITEQLLAQLQLEQTAENLQAVLNASPASIGLMKAARDPDNPNEIIDFRLAVGNEKLADFFGQPLNVLLGQSANRFAALLWDGQTLNVLKQVFYTHEFRYEERTLHTPNQERWLAISVMRQDDGVVLTGLDITELKQVQAQQQKWISELEESRYSVEALAALRSSLGERTELLRSFSHDLRSNFGIIQGGLQIMGMASSEGERAQMMEMVLRNVKQATGLLTDLLDLARLETGQQQRTMASFDAAQLLRELGESFQPMADNQSLALELSGPKSLPVKNDRQLVYRIGQNLIINAIKYTHAGKVTILWGQADEQWWFEIADTGPGIPNDLLERLNTNQFDNDRPGKNHSAEATSTPSSTTSDQNQAEGNQPVSHQADWVKLRGEGIGLRIVQELAQLLEARLDVHSQADMGTQFRVYFPLRYSD